MAHELEILEDGTASMAFTGDTPWHGLGTRVDGVMTAKEALAAAHLNWVVEKAPVYVKRGDVYEAVPDRYEVRRDIDKKTLGIVGSDYEVFQNDEMFDFFDTVVDSGDAKYETAGSLFGGKRVWLTAKLGEDIQIAGEDAHSLFLLLTSSHDGSRSLQAATTVVRAVCNNTVTMGLNSAKTTWSLSHRSELKGKAVEARASLQLAFKYADEFEREVEKLIAIQVDKDKFKEIISGILPDQKRQKDKNLVDIITRFESSPRIVDTGHGGTAWGAYNAVTEWLDHGREVRSLEARMTGLMSGWGARIRNNTHQQLLALA